MFQIDLEYNKGILFARLSGKLTRKSTYKLNNYLVPVILKHKIKYLVYNMFLLDSIDNAGVEAILNTKCAIRSNKGRIYLCEVSQNINKEVKKLHIKETDNELSALNLIEV